MTAFPAALTPAALAASCETSDTVTVLRAHDDARGRARRLAKTFTLATNGTVCKHDYDGAMWFAAEEVSLSGIRSLATLLRRIECETSACIIRGAPRAGVSLAQLRRRKNGVDAPFAEVPRRWVMIDVDGIPLPAGTSVIADPADAARTLLAILAGHAPELEGVTAVVQFSASAGLDELAEAEAAAGMPPRWHGVAKRGVSAHVWYWLGQPVGEAELGRWMAALAAEGLALDPATNRTVQPLYVAAPIFAPPLRDPLAGRRVVLAEGWADEAELRIPAEAPRAAYSGSRPAGLGRGWRAYLDAIGAPDFHAPMLGAVCSFIATNGPAADTTELRAELRARVAAADPGARPAATIADRASDRHIDGLIAWAVQRETEKRAERDAQAAQPVRPTYPDRGVSLAEGQRLGREAVAGFCARVSGGEAPQLLLRVTVGAGKTEVAIAMLGEMKDAAQAAGRGGALFYFVPRHDLGAELLRRIQAAHPTLRAAIWRGMEQPDPDAAGWKMCRDPELVAAAVKADQAATAACPVCPLRAECGYQRQRQQRPDVWLAAHNLMFQHKAAGLPDAAVVVVDESFMGAGLRGTDAHAPVQLAVSTLESDRTGALTGADRERLLFLRRRARAAIAAQTDDGGLLQEAFLAQGFAVEALGIVIPDAAAEWAALEWRTKPAAILAEGMDRAGMLTAFAQARSAGFNKRMPMLAERVRDLLRGADARSVNATLRHKQSLDSGQGSGDVIQFAWREDLAQWIAGAPMLFLDATTHADVLRCWAPGLEAIEIEVTAPWQHVRQVIGAEFGRSRFTQNDQNVRRLGDVAVVELAAGHGEVLVIAQAAVEELLRADLTRRFGTIPVRLRLAHHGAITGIDAHRGVARLAVVGRPAMNRADGERLAEVLRGSSVGTVPSGDALRWPIVRGGIRMGDGTGRAVPQPQHPDALVEAVRQSISEGAVMQGIGRARGVRRDAAAPVAVTVLGELALALTVAEVTTWDAAQPGRIAVAAAEAAITGRALPLAAADLAKARPDLFPTPKAAQHALEREINPQPLIESPHKGLGVFSGMAEARYRKAGGRGSLARALVPEANGRAALEAIVGPLSAFEVAAPAVADTPATIAAMTDGGKLMVRARLQSGAAPADPNGTAPSSGADQEGLAVSAMLPAQCPLGTTPDVLMLPGGRRVGELHPVNFAALAAAVPGLARDLPVILILTGGGNAIVVQKRAA